MRESIEKDDQALDSRRAYYLNMTYEDFIRRRDKLMKQAEKLNKGETS